LIRFFTQIKPFYRIIIYSIIIGLSCLFIWGIGTNGENWGDDNASYIMQSLSLINGSPQEYFDLNRFTIETSTDKLGPIVYPWGYPTLLAPIILIFGIDIVKLKLIGILSFILFLVILFWGFRKVHSDFWLISFVCIFAYHPFLLQYTDQINSDLPFLLTSTISIILIKISIIEKREIFSKFIDSIILGSVICISFFLRTNGILLIITLLISEFTSLLTSPGIDSYKNKSVLYISGKSMKSLNTLISFIPFLMFVLFTLLSELFLPKGSGTAYFNYLEDISFLSIKNQILCYMELPSTFFSGIPFPSLLFGASIPLAISGIIQRLQTDYHSIIYILLTFTLLIIWPYQQGLRFLFPILPLYFSFVISGLESFCEQKSFHNGNLREIISRLIICLVIFCLVENSTKMAFKNIENNKVKTFGPYTHNSQEMFTFIKEQTEDESIVIFWRPRMMSFMTGRKSFQSHFKESISGDYFCYYLKDDGWDQPSEEDMRIIHNKYKSNIVFENPDFRIYKLSE